MQKYSLILLLLISFATISFAKSAEDNAKDLGLSPASKASKQWERIFGNDEKMKELKIDKLSAAEKSALKEYLISYAADSDKPKVAGK